MGKRLLSSTRKMVKTDRRFLYDFDEIAIHKLRYRYPAIIFVHFEIKVQSAKSVIPSDGQKPGARKKHQSPKKKYRGNQKFAQKRE